jgi:hypothetical protein
MRAMRTENRRWTSSSTSLAAPAEPTKAGRSATEACNPAD